MQGKGLLGIARLDAVRVRLVDPFDVALLLVEESHGTGRAVLQDVEVVVLAVVAQRCDFSAVAIDIHLADDIAVHAFKGGAACEHVPVVLDLACLVILGGKVQRLGLEAEVDVLRHEDDLGLRLFGLQAKRGVQNLVVVGALREHARGIAVGAVGVHDDAELSLHAILNGNPILKRMRLTQPIEDADALTGFEVFGLVAHLEAVQLLKNSDGNRHFVVLEVGQRTVVKQQHTRVKHKNLGGHILASL